VAIAYLVVAVFLALCTVFALTPPRRPQLLTLVGFRLGFLVNELPFVAGALVVLVAVLAAVDGTVLGWVAVGLCVVSLAGLAVVVRRAFQARPAVERALAEGLGSDRQAPERRRLRLGRILFGPMFVRHRDVVRIADVGYGEDARFDLYHHRTRPTGGPVLVQLHGGPLTDDRKDGESRPLVYRLANRGWVCLSVNLRPNPTTPFPDHLVDVKQVIAWVREHAAEYGADPNTVFVSGSSSGAHLAALTALTPDEPAFQPGFEDVDTSVAAAVCLYGYYGPIESDGPPSDPASYLGSGAPPFFLAHGASDSMISAGHARRFVRALRAASSAPVAYAELPGGQHTFDLFHSVRFEIVVDAVEDFAAWVCDPSTRE
jgi:acetyl esterase/lipase